MIKIKPIVPDSDIPGNTRPRITKLWACVAGQDEHSTTFSIGGRFTVQQDTVEAERAFFGTVVLREGRSDPDHDLIILGIIASGVQAPRLRQVIGHIDDHSIAVSALLAIGEHEIGAQEMKRICGD